MSNQKNFNYIPIAMNKGNSDSGTSSRTSSIGNDTTRNIPNSYSSQALMNNNDSDSVITTGTNNAARGHSVNLTTSSNSKQWFTVGVLCFVNLINYMDRFTIAGVLTDIQSEFKMGDDWGGLLQTVFVISYMIFAPLFGYLGDRYSRRIIMVIGVFLWSTTTLLGSFMYDRYWFMVFRAFVGIGEASYSTIAPTIISDLFVHDMRSKMLALFYFAIPVGSGMGYIVGSETASAAGTWRWALRVTPILGVIAVVLLCLIDEPERGSSEGVSHTSTSSYKDDLKYLIRNRSFMLTTFGFTCVAFVTGALAWFGPKFIHSGLLTQPENKNITINDVSLKFGALTMVAGILGVPFGSYISTALVKRYPTVDPLICAFGLLTSVPLLAAAMILVSKSPIISYVLVFFGQFFLNMNWAVVCDMTLYVVVPTKRSTAEAFQILISHAFGDAGSPYLVGVISEAIKRYLKTSATDTSETIANSLKSLALTVEQVNATISNTTTTALTTIINSNVPIVKSTFVQEEPVEIQFQALQYALFSTSFVEVLGGIFFLITAVYIVRDKMRAVEDARENEVATNSNDNFTDASEVES